MRPLDLLRMSLVHLWQGPPGLTRSLRLEWRFVAIRWLGILFVAPGLLLANLPPDRLATAYVVLAVASAWNLAIQYLIEHHPRLVGNGYLTTLGDSLLNVAMVTVGGGFDSPFYYIMFTVSISAAMRYGYGPSLAMVLIYVGFDVLENLPDMQAIDGPFVFRSGFLCITAILAGYLREQAHRAEMALQERLRQADLLNDATATLGASLEFEQVLHAVAAAASHLVGSHCAVLQPSAELDGDAFGLPAIVHYPADQRTKAHEELAELCSRYGGSESGLQGNGHLFYQEILPSGQQAIVLMLVLPSRQIWLATLALAVPLGQAIPTLAPDILDSFVERITLAIENASLYRTLASRSSDLQRAYADLASAHQELLSVDEMKTNFLANVSHELRTPLSSIRSFSELLLTYDDTDVRQEFLQIINAESERLTRLVNDVLDITKIESGKMDWNMTTINIADVLHDSARTYAVLIETHQLAFEQDIGEDLPAIRGDRDRLQQVVGNMLNNSIKFTQKGSIKLSAWREADEVRIRVADTGIGIAPEDQQRIFEKFQQVGAMLTDKPRGTGLGLAICREIIEHHGGQMWVESEVGVGSRFTFTLPIKVDAAVTTEGTLVSV